MVQRQKGKKRIARREEVDGEETADRVVVIEDSDNIPEPNRDKLIARKNKGKRGREIQKDTPNKVVVVKNCRKCKSLGKTDEKWFCEKRQHLKCVANNCGINMHSYMNGRKKAVMWICDNVRKGDCEVVMCNECYWKRDDINNGNNRVEKRQRMMKKKVDMQRGNR